MSIPEPLKALAARPHEVLMSVGLRAIERHLTARPRHGEASQTEEDAVRIRYEPTLAFEPSTILDIDAASDDGRCAMTVSQSGLVGANGVMPMTFTELLYERHHRHHDVSFAAFIDLLEHRFRMLAYRAWAAARPECWADRPDDDRFAQQVGQMAGLTVRGEDRRRLLAAGLMSCAGSAEGLQRLLAHELGVSISILPWHGAPQRIPLEQRMRLGVGRLGGTQALGAERPAPASGVHIRIGPVTCHTAHRLEPETQAFARITDWVTDWCGPGLSWTVQVVVEASTVPTMVLGGARLGRDAWLAHDGPRKRNADDLCYEIALEPREVAA